MSSQVRSGEQGSEEDDSSGGAALDTKGYIAGRVLDQLFDSSPKVTQIGRYVVLDALGSGGMGRVYAAYDEQLDRKIALKVLSDETLASEGAQLRFQREAQTLARLAHANVATVYEVGVAGGEMYLAMEFIRGQDLSEWIRTKPSWNEVLEVFVQAGRGLAAAHEAGVIHRDLKPHNIMRGEDGVVKLLDFGLARMLVTEESEGSTDDLESISNTETALTRTGAVVGTPAYMSPEQRRGETLDVRSDQFSFCVAFYEALHGERPPRGEGKGAPRDLPSSESRAGLGNSGVPTWLHRIVARGLSIDPEQRWPSMAALLEALLEEPMARRRRRLMVVVGAGMLGLAGLAGQIELHALEGPCEDSAEHLRGVWDEARRAEVDARIEAFDLPYAQEVWSKMEPVLDAYASDWAAMHTEACEASAIRKEQSPRMLDLRMRCLDRAAMSLRATVDALVDVDRVVLRNALALAAGLDPLGRCEDKDALDAEVEPPRPQDEEAVAAARQELARSRVLARAGRGRTAREAIDAAKASLRGVDYEPVRTEMALGEGSVLIHLGEFEASEAILEEALVLASQWGQRDEMADAATLLLSVVGSHLGRPDEGLGHWPLAQGMSRGDPLREATALHAHGSVLRMQGRYDEARAEFRAALELLESHPSTTDELSIQHQVWQLHGVIATTLTEEGRYEEAEASLRRVLELGQQSAIPNAVRLARTRSNLATALRRQKRYEEAEIEQRAALQTRLDVLEPGDYDIGESRNNLALILRNQGKLAEAEVEYRAGLAITAGAVGAEHPNVAVIRHNLAYVLHEQGKHAEAEEERLAAIHTVERVLDSDHPMLVDLYAGLATSLLETGRPAEAREQIERVWERSQRDDIPARRRAEMMFLFARILGHDDEEGADRGRGRELARQALRMHREAAAPSEETIAEIQRWLDEGPDR